MVLNLVRKEGVPALAYPLNDASVLRPCFLRILHSDVQFVVSLEHDISIHCVDDKQLLTFRYEGDNLMPGKISLGDVGVSLPDGQLREIARQGQPRLRTLSFTLKAPCSVWIPHNFDNGVSSIYTRFHELLTLARATEVHVLFDTNWLGKDNLARLQSAIEGTRRLAGIPIIPQFARVYQQVDWSILNHIQDAKPRACPAEDVSSEAVPSIEDAKAGPSPIEDAVDDAPPPYAYVSSKRSRNPCTSLTPDSPRPKRLLQDTTCAPSPTERATSVSSLGAQSTASSTATVQVDLFQEIVTSAIEKVLPDMLHAQLPGILQDLLPEMLVGRSPSPTSSPPARLSQIANALTQHHRTRSHKPTPAAAFRAVISTHTMTHVQKIFTDALDEASDQASELHNTAGIEFDEILADTRLDFALIREDHITAFNNDCDEKLVEFKERLVEEKDEVEAEVTAHADKVVRKAWEWLNMVENEVCCRRKCLYGAKIKRSDLEQGRRSMSLPL